MSSRGHRIRSALSKVVGLVRFEHALRSWIGRERQGRGGGASRDIGSVLAEQLFSQFVGSAAEIGRAFAQSSWLRRREQQGRGGVLQRRALTREALVSEA